MFSVVIPSFNRLPQLARVLAGFCAQATTVQFEIIVVDNNGFDEDIDRVYREYVAALPLTLVRQPRLPHPRATSRARNLGLALARLEWIVNLDADCIPPPDYLDRLRAAVGAHGAGNPLLIGLRRFVAEDGIAEEAIRRGACDLDALPSVASPSNYDRPVDRRYPEIEHLDDCPHPWAFVHSGNLAYRRVMALAIGGFDEAFDGAWGYEDIDFAHRAITTAGARPVYVKHIECYHQDGDDRGAVGRDERFNKAGNPNWARICRRIPGFEAFKRDQYHRINPAVRL